MENFIKHIKEQRDNENSVSQSGPAPAEVPFFIKLENFKKEVGLRRSWIEEFMLDGDYDIPKRHLAYLGNELSKLYEQLEVIEEKEKEDCNCIQNISKEEFNEYLKSIGGLENGYGGRYWGTNKVRRFFFKITDWILWKLPYFHEPVTFSSKGSVRLFFRNIFYWMLKPILKDQKPKNPFRSMIDTAGSFSVGPGWYGLLKKLIEESIAAGWDRQICQVKEKFGGLRFYINGASTEVHDIISKYENLSYEICEECGEPGTVRGGGWIQTLCDKHYEKK
jgi:hypothetical protein